VVLIQALHWARGRPARNEREARTKPIKRINFAELLVGGRDARAPSEELVLTINLVIEPFRVVCCYVIIFATI